MNEQNQRADFAEIVAKGEGFFKSVGSVRCPYFMEPVHFNARGLEHLKFKRHNNARPANDQYIRFKLLHLAPEVLRLSRTIQGIYETQRFERIRSHGRTDTILKLVTYYEFIAVLKKVRIKVIVKQIENGEKFFWSIIPYWGTVKGGSACTWKRRMHNGNPEED